LIDVWERIIQIRSHRKHHHRQRKMVMIKKCNALQLVVVVLIASFVQCVTWSSNNPNLQTKEIAIKSSTYESLYFSYASTSPYSEVVKNVQNRLEKKMKSIGLFSNVENKLVFSNSEKATYFLEIQNTTISNHWAYDGVLYFNAFISGLTFTVWPFYFPVTERFEFTMHRYDTKKNSFTKVYSHEYTPTIHTLAGGSTIPILWVNFFTNGSYQLIDELAEDFLNKEEWKK